MAGAILIGLAAWAYQKSKTSSTGGRVTALVTAAARRAAGGAVAGEVLKAMPRPRRRVPRPRRRDAWQPYDAARAAELTAAGRPLLINFTASWCLTCLVNERNAFADSAVQEVFRGKGV